jgi:hypothetical protein
MSNRFLLFGERPFDGYARDKFSDVAVGICQMSDIEVLMYRDSLAELVDKTVKVYEFPELEISFENKVVDLVGRGNHLHTRYFAEYSLIVKGDTYFLGLSPFNSGYRPVDLPVEVKGNVLSFFIDTGSYHEELSDEARLVVKAEYERIKKYMLATVKSINETIRFYNKELNGLVTQHLRNKLAKAERCMKIKQSLDF